MGVSGLLFSSILISTEEIAAAVCCVVMYAAGASVWRRFKDRRARESSEVVSTNAGAHSTITSSPHEANAIPEDFTRSSQRPKWAPEKMGKTLLLRQEMQAQGRVCDVTKVCARD